VFTGIVEEVGSVAAVEASGDGVRLAIRAVRVADGLALGDSVSHDGVCLTVTSLFDGGYTVDAVATTLGRTTLGTFHPGKRVNLERALALGSRLGGHIVQGHVDAVGTVRDVRREGEHVLVEVEVPADVLQVTVLHGSITLGGVSLTVNALPAPGVVQVSIIPFTWSHTNFADLAPGDPVNVEGDVIGRYVRHLLGAPAGAGEGGAAPGAAEMRRAWGY
jgi:riboflavin synthase